MASAHSCPSCGAPVTFAYPGDGVDAGAGPLWTTVCAACNAVVVRDERDVAGVVVRKNGVTEALAAGASVLAVGSRGVHEGRAFTLIGAVQLRHELGGLWTEWVMAYEPGAGRSDAAPAALAWLAEHEGQLDVLAEADLSGAPSARRTGDVAPGQVLPSASGDWTVVERGRATIAAVAGEVPGAVEPDTRRPYLDLAGVDEAGAERQRVATLELGELAPSGREGTPRFFVGQRWTLAELGLMPVAPSAVATDMPPQCPSCFAELPKRLPQSQSIVCEKCHTAVALDGPEGTPRILFAQAKLRFPPAIAMGTPAQLGATFFSRARSLAGNARPWPESLAVTAVGHVVKSVEVDGETFYFEEYLLDAGAGEVYWLVQTDGDWYLTRRVDTQRVRVSGASASLDGVAFTLKEKNRGTTEQVVGEHPYAPMVGETAQLADYVCSPRMLSMEESPDEVVWTESLVVSREAVATAFNVRLGGLRGSALSFTTGGSSSGASGTSSTPTSGTVIAWIVLVIIVFIVLAVQCDDGGCGGFGRGGGFSFGK